LLIEYPAVVLATLGWEDVSSYYNSNVPYFAKEPSAEVASNPLTVFLGIDERDALSSSSNNEHKQQSLPTQQQASAAETTAADQSLEPKGLPYFVVDTTNHPELASKAVKISGGEEGALFLELRAEVLCLDFESTGVVAEARALVDWNKRSECGTSRSKRVRS
jgi:hypothetical protein